MDDIREQLRAKLEASKAEPRDPNDPTLRYERGLRLLENMTGGLADKRSTGEVAAPIDDVRFKRPKYAGADEDREDELVEKLATSVERNRCAAILRKMAERQHGAYQGLLLTALSRIEKGDDPL